MSVADELHKLHELHKAGAINDDEYALAKAKVLAGPAGPPDRYRSNRRASREEQTRLWAMLLHFSLLAGFLVPFAGLILPILIWQLKKAELPGIDRHGRVVLNWLITEILYTILFALLSFLFFIGIPLLIALAVVGIVFPIIGGIRANDGLVWRYPLSITFLPVDNLGPSTVSARTEERRNAEVEDVQQTEPDRANDIPERRCGQCQAPLPAGQSRCGECGWDPEESVSSKPL
jgi:uncharacterized Tic20 family protein